MVLIQVIAIHPIPCPHHSHIHAISYFVVGIICSPHRGHFRSGIICDPIWGSFAVLGSFADPYSTQEATIALLSAIASSNSYASFVLSKLPAWIHNSIYAR